MYHKVYPFSPTIWWVKADEFYRQMWELQNKKVVYLDEYDPNNPDHVVITFDGIYKNVLQYAAPIMNQFNYPFELFITSDYLNGNNSFDTVEPLADFTTIEELQELEKLGGRIQWHTRSHPNLKEEHNLEKITTELTVPQDLYQHFGKESFKWFAYPYGNFNQDVINETKKLFTGAISCNQGSDTDKFAYNRITVTDKTSFKPATIACIIASYNYGDLLAEAIDSVLKQTIKPDEILITDDCSSDNTQEIAEFYTQKYPSLIRYNRNETNLGIVRNFNKAVKLTKSDYVVFLGADNRFRSNYFEECANILNLYPKVGIAYTDLHLFGSRASIIYQNWKPVEFKNGDILNTYYHIKFPEYEEVEKAGALGRNNITHGSSMYRRKCFDEIGGYLEREGKPEDHDFFYRIYNTGYIAKKAGKTSLEYRQHSKDQANNKVISYGTILFYVKRYKDLEKRHQELQKVLNSKGFRLFKNYVSLKSKGSTALKYVAKADFKGLKKKVKKFIKRRLK